jgi:hypothetical protein
VTSPPEQITVECPDCGDRFPDWYRPSINLDIDDFDEEYLRAATTATCPSCARVVELDSLVVGGNVWRWG